MSLAELEADLQDQEATPPRRFTRPRDVLEYILNEHPSKAERIVVDMCVLQVEEKDLCWHIEFIESGAQDDFEKRKAIVLKLNDEKRKKHVFCVSLWKAKKQSREHVTGDDYVPGRSYVMNNVNGLHTFSEFGQGSLQARFAIKGDVDENRNKSKRKTKDLRV